MLNGAGQALIAIPSSTLLAEHTVEAERGRAYADHFALTHFFWLITSPAIGHASANWGAPRTFAAAGVVCLLVTLFAFALGYGRREAHTHEHKAAGRHTSISFLIWRSTTLSRLSGKPSVCSGSDAVSVTPRAFTNFSPRLERSDNRGIAIWKLVKR